MKALAGALLLLFPLAAAAHAFAQTYVLPLPFWMYAFAASAALALSFVVVGYFATAKSASRDVRALEVAALPWAGGRKLAVLRALSVAVLLLTLLTGLFGTTNPFGNFSVTFFWIVFVLGFTYVVALIGDVYAAVNPWRSLCDLIEWRYPGAFRARMAYPAWLGYYPALVLYMAFIWIELFAHASPRGLGLALLAYTLINLGGARLFGPEAWFRHGEMFAVILRLIGRMAPFEYTARGLRLRQPFVGLLKERAEHLSLLLIVLFMLVVDGLRRRASDAAVGAGVLEADLSAARPLSLRSRISSSSISTTTGSGRCCSCRRSSISPSISSSSG